MVSTRVTAGALAATRNPAPLAFACRTARTRAVTPAESQNVVGLMSTITREASCASSAARSWRIWSALDTSTSAGSVTTATRPTQTTGRSPDTGHHHPSMQKRGRPRLWTMKGGCPAGAAARAFLRQAAHGASGLPNAVRQRFRAPASPAGSRVDAALDGRTEREGEGDQSVMQVMAPAADVDVAKLHAALDERVDGEVRFDPGTLGAYAQDASNYRQVPIGVVVPRTVDAAAEAVSVCREARAPVLSRGGGTSLAGQCVNAAVVIDWTKYCHHLVSFDKEARTAVVQPGMALDKVNDALAPHGLMVGPKPSTHVSCTIGGMIGNNSCGSTAQAYGKMADSVKRLEILCYGGLRTWVGRTSDEEFEQIIAAGGDKAELYHRLAGIRDRYLGQIRIGYPDIPRRVSGYNLDHLLPEKGFHVARAVVGSESTLVTVLHAELDLVEIPRCRSLVVLGYPDITKAADAVPVVVRHDPLAVEGLDDTLIS